MTFKHFVQWCNKRACDGCWGIEAASYCMAVIEDVRSKPFWKREAFWKHCHEKDVLSYVVEPINKKIEQLGA